MTKRDVGNTLFRTLRPELLFVWLIAFSIPNSAFAAPCAANPNDWVADDAALQNCLNAGGTIDLDPGNPGYIVNSGLTFARDNTVLQSSQAPTQVTIIAGRDLVRFMLATQQDFSGLQVLYIAFNGKVDDMEVDGPYRRNRDACEGGGVAVWGFGNRVYHSAMVSQCATGLQMRGSNYDVWDNYIAWNGRDRFTADTKWADGITALNCSNGTIRNNTLVDNTDVDLVVGGGPCSIHHNTIWHGGKYAFAGLHVGFFQEGQGNHSGSVIQFNSIESSQVDSLGIGLLVGYHPWDANIKLSNAGSVVDNTITGAVINLLIEGVTDGTIDRNSVSGATGFWSGPGDCHVSANYGVGYDGAGSVFQGGWSPIWYHFGTGCGTW
jgi:hypothetical protein